MTFEQFEQRQRALAAILAAVGLGEGDRIAVLAANRPEFVEIVAAALRCGIVPVPVNALLTPSEYDYVLRDSGAALVFSDHALEDVPDGRVIRLGDDLERRLRRAGSRKGLSFPNTLGLAGYTRGRPMHYTSGTTGRPKGVWVPPAAPEDAARISARFRSLWQLGADEVHLVCSPLAHSAPLRYALRSLEAGGAVIVPPRFDPEATLRAITRHRVTSTFMVPTHLERVVAAATDGGDLDMTSMRLLAHAGAPIRPETKRSVLGLFPPGSVWEFYGATEGQATRISSDEWLHKPGSVGRPLPGVAVVVNDDGGRPSPPGEVGEVWVRPPLDERFKYWRDPTKTASAWRDDRFSVGDLGYLDEDGYLYLSGRKHDTIITGGVNVYPQEVERVLVEHPEIAEALVYGVLNDEWGEEVRALVVPHPGGTVTGDAVASWARRRLAGFKRPRVVEVVESLPRTPTGKLLRRAAHE